MGSLTLTNDETSSEDSSRNDRGSGGGRRAFTRTSVIKSTAHGRATHPDVKQWAKRIVRFVAVEDGRGPSQAKGRAGLQF